jgi:hypothetical protein
MPEHEHSKKIVYRIDSDKRIVYTNPAWTDFALDNDAEDLLPEKLLGNYIWDYISCPQTSHVYEEIVSKVVTGKRAVRFPFRCDSPSARRYLEMTVAPGPEGVCEFTSTVLREESREPAPLLDESAQRGEEYLRMCSWCKKIALSEDRWAEVEDAVRALDLFARKHLPKITHGMCSACYVDMEKTLKG